jgi:hypothetical protein
LAATKIGIADIGVVQQLARRARQHNPTGLQHVAIVDNLQRQVGILLCGLSKPRMIFIVVDLPLALPPSRQTICPCSTVRLRSK